MKMVSNPKKLKPVNRYKQIVGRWGEDLSANYLISEGFSIIEKNIKTPYGEIDLVIEKDGLIVFVEVKTRSNLSTGFPEEAISEEKIEHMLNSAEWYLEEHPEHGDNWRIDVISILGQMKNDHPQIEWFQNAA